MDTSFDDVIEILPPDRALLSKIGSHNLNSVFNANAESVAQGIIDASNNDLLIEMLQEIADLDIQHGMLSAERPILMPLVEIAFSLKTNAGLAGYDLISTMARSLYLYCEPRDGQAMTSKTRDVIGWHIRSIGQIAAMDLKGDGGPVGAAIRAELGRLASKPG